MTHKIDSNIENDVWLTFEQTSINLFGRVIKSVAILYHKADTKEYYFKKGELGRWSNRLKEKRKKNPGALAINGRFIQDLLTIKENADEVRPKILNSIEFRLE